MFLLIQKTGSATITATYLFTFHDVSINTMYQTDLTSRIHLPLHSTMFLLIHITMKQIELDDLYFTFHDVSINTSRQYQEAQYLLDFTFHDVSINTGRAKFYPAKFLSLHSTMFLLIRCYCHCRCCNSKLYIPRCFY